MGCCQSSETHFPLEVEKHHQKSSPTPSHQNPPFSATNSAICGVPAFAEFSFADLKAATNDFSSEFIVSESGEKAPLRLKNNHWIAVKKFTKLAWPDLKQFAEEAWAVGKLRHQRLANLIGYCCEGDERLLVAEYMPHDTLAKHLFHSGYNIIVGAPFRSRRLCLMIWNRCNKLSANLNDLMALFV